MGTQKKGKEEALSGSVVTETTYRDGALFDASFEFLVNVFF
jgi:hypothetical protein